MADSWRRGDHSALDAPTTETDTWQTLAGAAGGFSAVGLTELDEAQLHDRRESKVMLNVAEVPAILPSLAADYFILEHEGHRLQAYRNDYFDTLELSNYREHHNKRGNRMKLRYRTYVNSDLTFFEVKRRTRGRTVKDRRMSRLPGDQLWDADEQFFREQTGRTSALAPSITIRYDRVLLVKKDFSERVTIDMNLNFATSTRSTHASGLAVCEFKQPILNLRSPAMVAMSRRPEDFSKYCIGLAACDPSLRRNRFKPAFRSLDSIDVAMTEHQVMPL